MPTACGVYSECVDNLLSMHLPALQNLTIWTDTAKSYLTAAQLAVKQDWLQLDALTLPGSNLGLHSILPLKELVWTQLSSLDLSACLIDDADMQVLVACKWPKMSNLNLSLNQISHHGVRFLAQALWPLLSQLNFGNNDLCSISMQHLITAKWPHLTNLHLGKCNVTPDGFGILCQGKWPELTTLVLDAKTTCTAVDAFRVAQVALKAGSCVLDSMLRNLLRDFAKHGSLLQASPLHLYR